MGVELIPCPSCGGKIVSQEAEERKWRDFISYMDMLRTTSYRYGETWKEIACSEEGMWINLGKAVLASLSDKDEGHALIKYLEGNPSVANIYTKRPDEAVDLWLKRKEKRGKKPNTQVEVPQL